VNELTRILEGAGDKRAEKGQDLLKDLGNLDKIGNLDKN
jgi:hypothetical protein